MAPPGQPSTHRFRAVLLIVLTIGLVAVAIELRARSATWLAAYWLEQLEAAPETQVDTILERLAQLGPAGIPALVEAMDSPRELVAHAAKRRLWDEIGQWEQVGGREASRRAVRLAQALADRVERLRPSARQHSADLAARVLARPWTDDIVRSRRVMAACERVIRAAGVPRQPIWTAESPKGRPGTPVDDDPILEASRGSKTDDSAQGGSIRQLTYLSGGGLPIVSLEQTVPQSDIAASQSSQDPSSPGTQGPPQAMAKSLSEKGSVAQPSWLFRDRLEACATPLRTGSESETAPSPKLQALPNQREPGRLEAADGRPLAAGSTPPPSESPGQPAKRPESGAGVVSKELLQTDTLELMRRLRAANDGEAANAQLELRRRGFTEVHLELARQLLDPDPGIRRQLARMLPDLRSVNSTPWLVWLCRDSDPEVRLLAVTLLATSNDPTILAQVERIARADSDPRVQAQAMRIARHQSTGPDGASKTAQ